MQLIGNWLWSKLLHRIYMFSAQMVPWKMLTLCAKTWEQTHGQTQSTWASYKTGPTCLGDMHVSMFERNRQSLVTKTDHSFQEAISSRQELPQSTFWRYWGGLGQGISRHSISLDTDVVAARCLWYQCKRTSGRFDSTWQLLNPERIECPKRTYGVER